MVYKYTMGNLMHTLAHIYAAEQEAGLADQLKRSGSVATVTAPIQLGPKADFAKVLAFLQRNLASVQSIEELIGDDQADLSLIVSVLASVGWNDNDDVFTPAELWKSRGTAAHKPINDMHDEQTILGHMIESYAVDKSGDKLDDMPDEDFDVEVAGVLYSGLDELAERVAEIIAKAQTNEIFVSMEAWFPRFGYGLIDPATGTTHIVERDEATAFLTKHLRIYGGTGEYEGYRVGRVLQDFVFGGKGIVDQPANPESVIRVAAIKAAASSSFENTNLETLSEGGVTGMTEKEIQALQEELKTAKAGIEAKDAAIAKLTDELGKASESVSKVEELTGAVAEAAERIKALEDEKAENEKNLAEVTERAEKAEAELVEIQKAAKAKERLVKLAEVREVEDEKATLADIADMDDGEFERLLKYAGPAKAEEEEPEKEEEVEPEPEKEEEAEAKEETEAATAALDDVDEPNEPDFQGGNETPEEVEAEGFLALAHGLLGHEQEKKE